jgi:hemolysin activation/secretion protein
MEKGSQPYTVNMLLKVEDKNSFHFSQEYNNIGSRYVSRNRIGSNVEYSGIFYPGDKADLKYVMGMPSSSLHFVTAKYSCPVDNTGSRLGVYYTWCDFELQREFRILEAAGKSNIYGLFLTHPIRRTTLANADFIFGADYKEIKNYFFKTVASDDELRIVKTGISGDYIDPLKGRNYFSLISYNGIPGIGGLKKNDPMASRAGAGGRFAKAELQFARIQKFLFGSYILLRGNSQTASDVLPVPEQIAIGGADTVRGYPQSEFLGDNGYNATCELRLPLYFLPDLKLLYIEKPLNKLIQVLGFIDHGKISRRNALPGERKEDEISGWGAGAVLSFNDNVDFRVEIGWPIGDKDPSDGSESQTYMYGRVWF